MRIPRRRVYHTPELMNPLYQIDHVTRQAERAKNDKIALALTVMSVTLVTIMLAKELKGLFKEDSGKGRY